MSIIVLLNPNWPPMSILAIFKQRKFFSFLKFLGRLDEKRAAAIPWLINFANLKITEFGHYGIRGFWLAAVSLVIRTSVALQFGNKEARWTDNFAGFFVIFQLYTEEIMILHRFIKLLASNQRKIHWEMCKGLFKRSIFGAYYYPDSKRLMTQINISMRWNNAREIIW